MEIQFLPYDNITIKDDTKMNLSHKLHTVSCVGVHYRHNSHNVISNDFYKSANGCKKSVLYVELCDTHQRALIMIIKLCGIEYIFL